MVRNGTAGDLTAWLDEAATSEIASFTRGLAADQAAVVAALTEPWSNGQTEGQINRLKTLKRQKYGRANIELLKARLVAGFRRVTRDHALWSTGPPQADRSAAALFGAERFFRAVGRNLRLLARHGAARRGRHHHRRCFWGSTLTP